MLKLIQKAFFEHILYGDDKCQKKETSSLAIESIVTHSSIENLSIYRNNIFYGIKGVLKENFRSTYSLLGEKNFNHFVYHYIVSSPPSTGNLDDYCRGFPKFIKEFEFETKPEFAYELSLIDLGIKEVYCSALPKSIEPKNIEDISADKFENLYFKFNNVFLIKSKFPIFKLWSKYSKGNDENGSNDNISNIELDKDLIDNDSSNAVIIYKNHHQPLVSPLTNSEYTLLQSLFNGINLLDSIIEAVNIDSSTNINQFLKFCIKEKIFASYNIKTI